MGRDESPGSSSNHLSGHASHVALVSWKSFDQPVFLDTSFCLEVLQCQEPEQQCQSPVAPRQGVAGKRQDKPGIDRMSYVVIRADGDQLRVRKWLGTRRQISA